MSATSFVHEIQRHLEWNLRLVRRQSTSERLEAQFRKGELTLTASDPWVEAFAVQTLAIALRSGHIGDFLGITEPRFELRAVKIDCEIEEDPETLLQWLIGCGFNCLIGDQIPQELLGCYGMRPARWVPLEKPDPKPFETRLEALAGQVQAHECDSRMNLFFTGKELRDAEWLPQLLDDMDRSSWFAADRSDPFWDRLRTLPDTSSTPLVYVTSPSMGMVPSHSRQPIKGVVINLKSYPQDNQAFSKALWVAGQSLWWSLTPHELEATWEQVFKISR